MKRFSLLLIATIFAGCNLVGGSGDTSNGVTFTTEQDGYALGSTVTATLANSSDEAVGYNLCFSALERRQGDDWVFAGPSIVCQAIGLQLKPGEESRYSVTLVDSLNLPSSGTYRITTDVEIEGEDIVLKTRPFSISAVVQQD